MGKAAGPSSDAKVAKPVLESLALPHRILDVSGTSLPICAATPVISGGAYCFIQTARSLMFFDIFAKGPGAESETRGEATRQPTNRRSG